jgi:hypothetical protein
MDVWVLEWSYPYDGENNITLWASQVDAQKQALKEINDLISNDWDMDNEDAATCADEISSFMGQGRYGDAIKRFNDYQDEYNSDYCQYWHVRSYPVLSSDEDVTAIKPVPYKATTSGATCRGPCGQFNEYAYADKPDGTHMCRQCSTFHSIFGTTKP